LRVEARRLLSLLDLLSPFLTPGCVAKAQAALKCHLDTFDDLRDAHVQLEAVRSLRKDFSAARQFFRFLKKRETKLCRWTSKHSKKLRYKSLARLIAVCRRDTRIADERYSSPRANTMLLYGLTGAFGATTRLKNRIKPDDTHSIHCTRIAFKKFRYMVEALAGCLPWADERFVERMRRYQGLMGDIQDAQVLLHAFEKFCRKEKIEARPAAQFTQELLRRRQNLIATYLSAADRLLEFWPPGFPNIKATRHRVTVRTRRQRKLTAGSVGRTAPTP
jgi:CHAD domain-containing protein